MEKQKSKLIVMNSLTSRFFIIFNSPLLIALYLVFYTPEGYMTAIYIIMGIWLSFMSIMNKVQMFSHSIVMEPWISVLLHLGLKTRIEKSKIKSVEYMPAGKLTGEMVVKYMENQKEKEAYLGMTENGVNDVRVLRKFFRQRR